jgi:hypothetical protein
MPRRNQGHPLGQVACANDFLLFCVRTSDGPTQSTRARTRRIGDFAQPETIQMCHSAKIDEFC